MPSVSKSQLNYFKLVKAHKDGGINGFFSKWKELYNNRPFPDRNYINKLIKTSKTINPADLEDMASGVKGDDILGEKRDFKVGYWAKFNGVYRDMHDEVKEGEFIAQIDRINPSIKLVNFKSDGLYNKNGIQIMPLKRAIVNHPEFQFLDYVYFKDIIETAKTKDELVMKKDTHIMTREEFAKIVKEAVSEAASGDVVGGTSGDEKFGDYTGVLAEENILDSEGKKIITGRLVHYGDKSGKVLGLGIDDNNNITVRVKWFLPLEIKDKIEVVKPTDLVVYL